MAYIIFVLVVVFWWLWLPPLINLLLYFTKNLPFSFFVPARAPFIEHSTEPKPPRYIGTTFDSFMNPDPYNGTSMGQFMSADAKAHYLRSEKWQELRKIILERDAHRCQSCWSRTNLQVHHISYLNLGNELQDDLVCLCSTCHEKLHLDLGYDRETTFDISTTKNPFFPQQALN
jgi:hypothetical protein